MAFVNVGGETADDVWKAAYGLVADGSETKQNPTKGDSRELHHVAISISDPRQRWVVSRTPALNPAFAIAELIWIIRGRNDLAFLERWNSKLGDFSGRSPKLHGAYGYRIRNHFGVDQLKLVYETLKGQPYSRQAVVQIWDASLDLPRKNGAPNDRDIPCNLQSVVRIAGGALEWLQIMRSNDVILGLPYNLLQWTTLQEVVAGWLGVEVGTYNQISDSLHLYERDRAAFNRRDLSARRNSDDLSLGFNESVQVYAALEQAMETIADREVADPATFVSGFDLPLAHQNWLYLVLCEMYRRSKESSKMQEARVLISNPLLGQAWDEWLGSRGGRALA